MLSRALTRLAVILRRARPRRAGGTPVPAARSSSTRPVRILAFAALLAPACVEPPPRIPAIPESGFAIRLHVFGAQAKAARRAFDAVKVNNRSFSIVGEGGDGEVVVGLDEESTKCVEPTALCSFRISYRVKDPNGRVVEEVSGTVTASSDRCSMLCAKALNNTAARVVEAAAKALRGSSANTPSPEGNGKQAEGYAKDAKRGTPSKPVLCEVGAGPRLPSEDAETRIAQVEALERLGVLDRAEYDCLRKAYLDRL